ncbi:hypothetical protein, partial [Tritonibacter sp. SIMBA_163]|uniref:hypothetical protein n=1 Tax=Tritonibacter sp. SIMBA_163 TaxID=3080868 RepID=UPI0039813911
MTVGLDRLALTAYGFSPRLAAPTQVTVNAAGGISIAPVRLALADGTVEISGTVGEALDLTVALSALRLGA